MKKLLLAGLTAMTLIGTISTASAETSPNWHDYSCRLDVRAAPDDPVFYIDNAGHLYFVKSGFFTNEVYGNRKEAGIDYWWTNPDGTCGVHKGGKDHKDGRLTKGKNIGVEIDTWHVVDEHAEY